MRNAPENFLGLAVTEESSSSFDSRHVLEMIHGTRAIAEAVFRDFGELSADSRPGLAESMISQEAERFQREQSRLLGHPELAARELTLLKEIITNAVRELAQENRAAGAGFQRREADRRAEAERDARTAAILKTITAIDHAIDGGRLETEPVPLSDDEIEILSPAPLVLEDEPPSRQT